MRNLRCSIRIGMGSLLVLGVTSFGIVWNVSISKAKSSVEEKPSVYVSTDPNVCANFSGLEYRVFVNAPLDNNLSGISFDLDMDGSPPMPVVVPEPGVTFSAMDISHTPYHFEATWTSRPLEHEPIFRLVYGIEPSVNLFSPYSVTFETTSGGSVPGYGMESITCCLDCFDCSLEIFASNHVFVPVGGSTIIPFKWAWYCWYPGGGPITASDTEGWVATWDPEMAGDEPTCGLCIVPVYDGWVEVFVPQGVPVGTMSSMTIVGWQSSTEVVLEADDTIPVNVSTWGKVKALYR